MPSRLALIALFACLAALGLACRADREPYVEANRSILAELPEPAGVERLSVEDNPYYEERGPLSNVPVGWTTNAVYEAPAALTAMR